MRRRIDQQMIVFSGLWGLVVPTDPIPFYKLKMTAKAPRGGRLAAWWRPRIAPVLDTRVDGRVVWDLLPNEHVAAWPTSDAPKRRIAVRFLDDTGGPSLITVSHWNKLLKGALVRHVVGHQLNDPDGLTDFEHPQGYRYRPDLTVEAGGRTVVSMVAERTSPRRSPAPTVASSRSSASPRPRPSAGRRSRRRGPRARCPRDRRGERSPG